MVLVCGFGTWPCALIGNSQNTNALVRQPFERDSIEGMDRIWPDDRRLPEAHAGSDAIVPGRVRPWVM
jgi:hypothetical protein